MLLRINHQTTYQFDQPVQYALTQVRLTPKSRAGQSIINWRMDLEGAAKQLEFNDENNNLVTLLSIEPGRIDMSVRCTGEVETSDTAGIVGTHGGYAPLWFFRRSTPLTKPGQQVRAVIRKFGGEFENDITRFHELSSHIAEIITYKTGHTDTGTTAESALAIGHGVCQDHAHVFITCARAMGYPARYVSGYLMMNDRIDQDATHAWAEVYLNDIGWVGFDVSNGISPDERYVRVATGLDYRDAAPMSGIRLGDGLDSAIVSIQVQQ